MKRLLTIALALLLAGAAWGATYYVDHADGNDASDGTSPATAFQHTPHSAEAGGVAATTTIESGDVILYKGGVVYAHTIIAHHAGTSGEANHVFFRSGHKHSTPWGTGRAIVTPPSGGGFRGGTSYITCDGLEFASTPTASVWIGHSDQGNQQYYEVTLNDLYIHDVVSGQSITAQRVNGLWIKNVSVVNTQNSGIYFIGTELYSISNTLIEDTTISGATAANDAISIHPSEDASRWPVGSGHTIRRVVVSGTTPENCLDFTSGNDVLVQDCDLSGNGQPAILAGGYTGCGNMIIERVWVHNSQVGGVGITFAKTDPGTMVTVRNCVFDSTGSGTSAVIVGSSSGVAVAGVAFYNNTIVKTAGGGDSFDFAFTSGSPVLTFKNNVFAFTGRMRFLQGFYGPNASNLTFDYNLWTWSTNAYSVADTSITWTEWQAYGHDANGLVDDPELTAYVPSVTSPVLGAAVNLSATGFSDDYSGKQRNPAAWDIGAYQLLGWNPHAGVAARFVVLFGNGFLGLAIGFALGFGACLLYANHRQAVALRATRAHLEALQLAEIANPELRAAMAELDYMLTHGPERPEDKRG